jgi:hypothetical protein
MLFKDTELEIKYRDAGFVLLNLLGDAEINRLAELYYQVYPAELKGLQPLLRVGGVKQNIALHYQIAEIVMPALEKVFQPFAFNANHFIVKGANDPKEFCLHQDWNVVDENKYIAAHIWIALQDIDEKNGGLFVVQGSHRFFNNVRSGSCGIAFIETTEKVRQQRTSLKIKAGEAVIYQQALFHGSFPNFTSHPRIVCLTSIRPAQTPMLYFHQQNEKFLTFEISPEILFEQINTLEIGDPPISNYITIYEEGLQGQKTNQINNNIFEEKL